MTATTYNILITGTSRGIGRALAEKYLSQANTTVIATVRDINSSASKELPNLPAGKGSKIIICKLENTVQADAKAVVNEIQTKHGIAYLDLVIANAGTYFGLPSVAKLDTADLLRHLEVNNFSYIWLFQATLELLERAKAPKLVYISSSAGSLGQMLEMPHNSAAYGASKAISNFHTLKIHCEHEKITAMAVNPGFVQTEMGNKGAKLLGFDQAPNTIEESVDGVYTVVDVATRDTHSGKFWDFTGSQIEW